MTAGVRRVLLLAALGAALGGRARAQPDPVITGTAIGGVRICQPLDSVSVLYRGAVDTMLFGGASETRWPGKYVELQQKGYLFAEASWVDRTRVWRVSTNSAAFATAGGLRVGATVAEVLAARERMAFRFPQGSLIARLSPSGIFVTIDSVSAARFYAAWPGQGNPLRFLERTARITEISVAGGCRGRGAAAPRR